MIEFDGPPIFSNGLYKESSRLFVVSVPKEKESVVDLCSDTLYIAYRPKEVTDIYVRDVDKVYMFNLGVSIDYLTNHQVDLVRRVLLQLEDFLESKETAIDRPFSYQVRHWPFVKSKALVIPLPDDLPQLDDLVRGVISSLYSPEEFDAAIIQKLNPIFRGLQELIIPELPLGQELVSLHHVHASATGPFMQKIPLQVNELGFDSLRMIQKVCEKGSEEAGVELEHSCICSLPIVGQYLSLELWFKEYSFPKKWETLSESPFFLLH